MTRIFLRTRNLMKALDEYEIDPHKGAEVGVWLAQNARSLLHIYPKLHLVLVDSYKVSQRGKREEDVILHPQIHKVQVKATNRLSIYNDRIKWLIKLSIDAAKDVEDGSLDYTFIDATHTYEAVKEDIKAWLPKVRIGGLLTGHDFAPGYGGLKKAVRERFSNVKVNTDVWYVKITEETLGV